MADAASSRRPPPPRPPVPIALWRELYSAAVEFQQLAPWEWMADADILGVNNAHGVRLISVLGANREVFGSASYRGTVGTNFLLELLAGDQDPEDTETMYRQDAVLVDFVPRKQLQEPDEILIQQMRFQPAPGSPKRFPEFQSHRPGYLPWFVDAAEARMILDDIRHLLPFARLLRDHPGLYDGRRREDEFPFHPQAPAGELTAAQLEWHRMVPAPPPPEPPPILAEFDVAALRQARQLPDRNWESLTFFGDPLVEEGVDRPFFPHLSLVVDERTGIVLAVHLGQAGWTAAQCTAAALAGAIQKHGVRPGQVRLDDPKLQSRLDGAATLLGLEFQVVEYLPMAAAARAAFEAHGPFL